MKNYLDIFWQFLILGFTSFSEVIANLSYLRKAFILSLLIITIN